jgi:hypothetical protein
MYLTVEALGTSNFFLLFLAQFMNFVPWFVVGLPAQSGLQAPVSGSKKPAVDGTLIFLTAGTHLYPFLLIVDKPLNI